MTVIINAYIYKNNAHLLGLLVVFVPWLSLCVNAKCKLALSLLLSPLQTVKEGLGEVRYEGERERDKPQNMI